MSVIVNQQGLRHRKSTAASRLATQLTCGYRFVQLTKESFDFAQALLDLVVLAAAVDTRRCRERFGHLYGRRWSQRERRPFLRQMAACTIARDMGTGGLGWYYVHAEGSGATSQARGQVTDTRGSHNDAALASYSPNCTF